MRGRLLEPTREQGVQVEHPVEIELRAKVPRALVRGER